MHLREAHKCVAITKQVSQTCSLTQHHHHQRPLNLQIPAAASWLLSTGNTVSVTLLLLSPFANSAAALDTHKYSSSTAAIHWSRTGFREQTPPQLSPCRAHSLCSSSWGKPSRRLQPTVPALCHPGMAEIANSLARRFSRCSVLSARSGNDAQAKCVMQGNVNQHTIARQGDVRQWACLFS